MRGARVPYQNPMISYCKTAPDQICRRAPNGRQCQAISRQKSAGRRQIWSGARLRAAEPPAECFNTFESHRAAIVSERIHYPLGNLFKNSLRSQHHQHTSVTPKTISNGRNVFPSNMVGRDLRAHRNDCSTHSVCLTLRAAQRSAPTTHDDHKVV